jgi:hypothetical protein
MRMTMKAFALALTLAVALASTITHATSLGLMTVKQPIYFHDSDGDVEIRILDVHVASSLAAPEAFYAAITLPFVPITDGSWKEPADVNIASRYGIRVSADGNDGANTVVTIDASKAKAPQDYPFTIEQVIDSVTTCVKLMTPIRPEDEQKLTLKVIQPKK